MGVLTTAGDLRIGTTHTLSNSMHVERADIDDLVRVVLAVSGTACTPSAMHAAQVKELRASLAGQADAFARLEKSRDRITAMLALPQAAPWSDVVAAVEHMTFPDKRAARDRALAWETWIAAFGDYDNVARIGVEASFDTWWKARS